MTIPYSNGTVLEAILLSHGKNEIHAIAAGSEDVQVFKRVQGTWISEDLEPITIRFDWQVVAASPAPAVEDCICPKELAAHLIRLLLAGDDSDESVLDAVPMLGPQEEQAAIHHR